MRINEHFVMGVSVTHHGDFSGSLFDLQLYVIKLQAELLTGHRAT